MRRISFIVTVALVCIAGATFVPGATAGNFDEAKMGCAGEDPATCPPATVGQSYSLTIYLSPPDSGRGEDFACARFHVSSGSFPPGLSISDEGIISGTPTQAGSYGFYLQVTYDKETACTFKNPSDDRFILNVNSGVSRMFVTTTSLPDANIGQAYAAPALATQNGTASSWNVTSGSLPPGVQLASNGVISGTPTASGQFTFQVQANGPSNNDTKSLSIFVLAPLELQTLSGAKPPARGLTAKAAVGVPLATGVKAVGGRGPYTFAADGALPPGINLDAATGAITGAGTTAGRYTSSITVTDQAGTKASVSWSFTILPLLDFRKGKGLPVGTVDRRYSAKIPVSGKDAKTAQFAVSGQIPPGLDLDETTGRLTGILLRAGNYRLRVFAFPETGSPISKVFRIRVRG